MPTLDLVTGQVVTDRLVYTYGHPWPQGLLTGKETEDGFLLEHVVAFPGTPPGTLLRVLRSGIEEAWARGYDKIVLCIPTDHPLMRGLTALAQRCGFTVYANTEAFTWWVRRP